jgi:hypothetical protein
MAYLDSAQDRVTADARARHDELVYAVRAGTISAHDHRWFQRWVADRARAAATALAGAGGVGLTGAALERAVGSLRITNPDLVAVRVATSG